MLVYQTHYISDVIVYYDFNEIITMLLGFPLEGRITENTFLVPNH